MRSLNLIDKPCGSVPDDGDSWDNPVRMIYLITIQVLGPDGWRFTSFRVNNFHNASAIQQAFEGVATVDVDIRPDVPAYLEYLRGL